MIFSSVSKLCLTLALLGCISCSGGKSVSSAQISTSPKTEVPAPPKSFKYRLYFGSQGSMTLPHDQIWIDSTGQMTFDTQQHMKDGSWKSPRGLAYLEPKDEDSLLRFIRQDALFSIEEADVSPQCADGDIYKIHIIRSDLAKELQIQTNTCALEFNLLTGQQRKIFSPFIAFFNRLRDKYRPLFPE
jgi:hypothetical protein